MRVASMCGSLGPASTNQAALDVAVDLLVAAGHVVVPVEGLAEVPAFQPQLVEHAGPVVDTLRRTLESCDGLLLAAPEYAGGLAGAVKNALDWLVGAASLYQRPVAVLSAGTTGGAFAIEQAVRTLSWQGALVVEILGIAAPRTKVDADGRFVDADTLTAIRRWATGLVTAIDAPPAERLAHVAQVVGRYGIEPGRITTG
jgi:chromate reductase